MDFVLNLEYNEKDFLAACIRKERWAQKVLYETYYSDMLSICMRYSNNSNSALDLMHDGFIKVYRRIDSYKKGTSLFHWIKRIMINTCIDHYRKTKLRITEDLKEVIYYRNSDPDAIAQCTEKEILKAIMSLSKRYRMVFNLYVIEGYSHKEVGKLLGITESTSRSNLVKARTNLKAKLVKLNLRNER